MDLWIRISDEDETILREINIWQEGSDSECADEITEWILENYDGAKNIEYGEAEESEAWENNSKQFPRLLAELRALGLTDEQYKNLAEAMDLTEADIDHLLERAETAWQVIKFNMHCPIN